MSTVSTHSYARTNTAIFVSDKLRNLLKLLVRYHGLNPQKLVDAWSGWVDRAARTWLESGHLTTIVIEFYFPGSNDAVARWDFPVRYDGNGADELWVDRAFFEGAMTKANPPPAGCEYRVVLKTLPNEPKVDGVGDTTLRSITGLVGREIGTVIATPDIMASARYYRS